MWEDNDKNNYDLHKLRGLGQICNDSFSKKIQEYASNDNNKTFLEIGTWNGLGSTKAFSEGFKNRKTDYIFYSLECNKDKHQDASKLYEYNVNMKLLNEVVFNEEPENFYDIFPQCRTNALFKKWNDVDMINMKKCDVFINRTDLPEIFDVLLLDGGEFTTYFEYQILKKKCKYLMLDDIKVDKCKLIVEEIFRSPDVWQIIEIGNDRNGYLIALNCEV